MSLPQRCVDLNEDHIDEALARLLPKPSKLPPKHAAKPGARPVIREAGR